MKQPLTILLLFFSFASAQETIAVIEFEGIGISQIEAKALSNRLRDELVSRGNYRIFERGKMEEILKEQAFSQSGCTSNECAMEVGKLLSVEGIIIGSISNVGSVYSVSARIVSVESGEITKSAIYDYQGSIDDLLTTGMKYVSELLFSGVSTTSEPVTEPEPPTSIATPILQVPEEEYSPSGGQGVVFRLNVEEALLWLNEVKQLGSLPSGRGDVRAKIIRLDPGEHTFRIEKKGYTPKEGKIKIKYNVYKQIPIELEKSGSVTKSVTKTDRFDDSIIFEWGLALLVIYLISL